MLGGLVGVELTKRWIGLKQSTGDAFVYPLIVGTAIDCNTDSDRNPNGIKNPDCPKAVGDRNGSLIPNGSEETDSS